MNLSGAVLALPLCILAGTLRAEATDAPAPIPYDVTSADGRLIFAIDPATAYKGLPRGTIDVEPMNEVKAYALPSSLPPPTVVPAADPVFYIQLRRAEKEGPPLKGEDLVFRTIGEDEKKERCLIYGESCSALEIIEDGQPE